MKTISGNEQPIISIRSKTEFSSKHNQTNVYPDKYNCYVRGGVIRLDFYWPIDLVNATWANDNGSTAEADTAATSTSIGDDSELHYSEYLDQGVHQVDLAKMFEINDEGILTQSEGGYSIPYCVVGTLISGSSADIDGSFTYRELR